MRVLIAVHGFPPAAMGGTEIYAHDLAHALRDGFGHEIIVLTRDANPKKREYTIRDEVQDGVRIVHVNNTYRRCREYADTYANETIRGIAAKLLDETRPDVAHIHHLTGLTTGLIPELEARGIPCLFTLQDYWLICHRGQLFDRNFQNCVGPYPSGCSNCLDIFAGGWMWAKRVRPFLYRIPAFPGRGILRRLFTAAATSTVDPLASTRESAARLVHMREVSTHVTRFLAPSRTLRERFLEFGIPEDRLTLQEQGIDQRGFRGVARTKSDRLRVGLVGSLIVSKGAHVLLEAFEGIPTSGASLHIYGSVGRYHDDDTYRKTIEPLLDRPYVHHDGPVPHDQVPRAFASVDVLVVPSIWIENAPFVIREAFVSGVPVVASNLGGMAEMVTHEKNGLLFRPGDVEDLRRAIRRLIDEPGLLEKLRAGIPRVKTIEEDAEWTSEIYRQLSTEAAAAR